MKIHFCDLCNESVPQNDLDEGRSFLRKGRVICAKCDEIMGGRTSAGASTLIDHSDPDTKIEAAGRTSVAPSSASEKTLDGSDGGGHLRARGPVQYRIEGGGGLVAGFLSAVAVVLVAVVAVMLMDRIESVSEGVKDDVSAVQRDVAAAEGGLAMRIEGLKTASFLSSENVDARFDALLAAGESRDRETSESLLAVGGRLDDLAERLNSLATTERNVADHARALASLEAGLSSIRLDVGQLAADLEARPVIIAAEPEPVEPTGPVWLALVEDLSSSNSGVRWNAVEDLGHTGDPAVVPHLLPVLNDEDTFVRMAAARVLGELGGDESVGPLIDTLSDPAESVRDAAVASLRQITGQNFRFDPLAKQADRTKRIRAWRDWWEKQGKA